MIAVMATQEEEIQHACATIQKNILMRKRLSTHMKKNQNNTNMRMNLNITIQKSQSITHMRRNLNINNMKYKLNIIHMRKNLNIIMKKNQRKKIAVMSTQEEEIQGVNAMIQKNILMRMKNRNTLMIFMTQNTIHTKRS